MEFMYHFLYITMETMQNKSLMRLHLVKLDIFWKLKLRNADTAGPLKDWVRTTSVSAGKLCVARLSGI